MLRSSSLGKSRRSSLSPPKSLQRYGMRPPLAPVPLPVLVSSVPFTSLPLPPRCRYVQQRAQTPQNHLIEHDITLPENGFLGNYRLKLILALLFLLLAAAQRNPPAGKLQDSPPSNTFGDRQLVNNRISLDTTLSISQPLIRRPQIVL